MQKTYILITYYAGGAQGSELEIAVSGWRQHFKDDYQIVIIGDDPHINGDDITYLPLARVPGAWGKYQPALDINNKLAYMIKQYPDIEGFIWSTDDNYLVKDIHTSDVRKLYCRDDNMIVSNQYGGWRWEQYRTRRLLDDNHLPHRNWTTHIPCWFNAEKLALLIEQYNALKEGYIIENLYFNLYHGRDTAAYCADVKFQLCCEKDILKLSEEMETKTWICNSPEGWSPELEKRLKQHYSTCHR